MDDIEARLEKHGITLPQAAAPAANYVPYLIRGSELFISGQLPMRDGELLFEGRIGDNADIEMGANAALLSALNILAQAKSALGSLEHIVQCVRLGGFVACTPEFTDHPQVINGASDIMVDILGEAGRHTRFAVGVASLPFGALVEIDALFHVKTIG